MIYNATYAKNTHLSFVQNTLKRKRIVYFNKIKTMNWAYPRLVFLLGASMLLMVHALWFVQVPVWYPVRCFLNALPVTLFFFIPALLGRRIAKPWLIVITPVLLIPTILAGMHLFYYQTTISQQSLFAIFETNLSETREFLFSQFSLSALLYFFALLILPLALLYKALKAAPRGDFKAARLLAAVLIVAAGILTCTGRLERLAKDNIACQFVQSCLAFRQSVNDLEEYMAKASTLKAPGVAAESSPITLVVLIGESSSRHHFGIYGYFRNTTPRLASLQKELLIFKDAISPFGRTTLSVAAALTCTDVPAVGDMPLVNIFRQAGFETVWISNQSTVDDTNMIVRLISGADRKIYLNKGGDQAYSRFYDGNILPVLDEILAEPAPSGKRLILIHTMGSHFGYAARYPKDFARFTKSDDLKQKPWLTKRAAEYINHYDNSIVYTDHIIAQVVEKLRSVQGSAMLFFSDHGEEVFDTKNYHGHLTSADSRYFVDIPLMIWLSDSYRADLPPETLERWKKACGLPFVNNAAPYIMLEMGKISFPSPHWKDSPISAGFTPAPRIICGVNYDERFPADAGVKEPIPLQQ